VHEVRPGQLWADNDARAEGRTLRVDRIAGDYAVCTVLTNSALNQAALDEGKSWARDMRGRPATILLRRFRPGRSGYTLIKEAEDA